jgi:hypothetical protein
VSQNLSVRTEEEHISRSGCKDFNPDNPNTKAATFSFLPRRWKQQVLPSIAICLPYYAYGRYEKCIQNLALNAERKKHFYREEGGS